MKSLFLPALAIAAIVAPATAQPATKSKHDGSYHSAVEGTYWSDGKLPKGFSLTISLKFADGKLEYKSVNDTDKAKPMGLDYTAPTDGTVIPLPGQARYNQVSVKQLGPDEYQLLKMKDGDVIVAEFWVFRPDGKTLVRRGVGKSPEGVSKAFQETFVRI